MAKPTKKFSGAELERLKLYYRSAQETADRYWENIKAIEMIAKADLGIEIELFHVDGELVGVDDYDREYKLVQGEELERDRAGN